YAITMGNSYQEIQLTQDPNICTYNTLAILYHSAANECSIGEQVTATRGFCPKSQPTLVG
ncbi:hypothetical protein L9F63_006601, partial [Diploptera punctata]